MKDKLIAGLAGLALGAGGVALAPSEPISKVQEAQQEHYKATDTYFQCIEYKTPKGEVGYEIIYQDDTGKHSIGFGPEGATRTSFVPKSATSTP